MLTTGTHSHTLSHDEELGTAGTRSVMAAHSLQVPEQLPPLSTPPSKGGLPSGPTASWDGRPITLTAFIIALRKDIGKDADL